MNIRTILRTGPKLKPQEMFTIIRGATATINYNLLDQVFSFNDIEQLYFIFKQDDVVSSYTMFNYIIQSEDTEVIDGKVYYENVQVKLIGGKECTGTVVENPEGSPVDNNWFELVDIIDGQNDLLYIKDSHFERCYDSSDEKLYDFIAFGFSSNETKALQLTAPHNNMQFEVAIRLNTDSSIQFKYTDTMLIQPQLPIAVLDSLFSQIE